MNKHLSMTNYACRQIPFYREYYANYSNISDKDFMQLPLLEKTMVREFKDSFYNKDKCGKIQVYKTSGTTGIPLDIYWEKNDYIKSNFYTWYLRKKWYGISPADKYCTFHSVLDIDGISSLEDVAILSNGRIMSLGRCMCNDSIVKKYIDLINNFEPIWVLGQPSFLYQIACYLERNRQRINSLKYIELNGEFVETGVREKLQSIFNIPIGELYGSVEFNGIALRCPYGHMHVLTGNVYIEQTPNDELIITGLTNSYMPLIKYRLGDYGRLFDTTCDCGLNGQILQLARGRENHSIRMNNGTTLELDIVNNIINEIQTEQSSVIQFRIEVHQEVILLVMFVEAKNQKKIEFQKQYFLSKFRSLPVPVNNIDIKVISDERFFYDNKDEKFQFVRFF